MFLKILIAFLFVLQIVALSNANKYYGYKIIEMEPMNSEHFSLLQNLEKQEDIYDFISLSRVPERKSRVIVSPSEISKLCKILLKNKLQFNIINHNLGKTLSEEFRQNAINNKLLPLMRTQRLSTQRYYSQSEINEYIENLAEQYPQRVYVRTVGKSYEKLLLKTITITNGDGRQNKNVILLDGGVHAREWISPAAAIYIIEQLVEQFEENRELLLDYDWVILPVVNADGYEYTRQSENTRMWRKTRKPNTANCIGTDPNRNFGFHWNEVGSSKNPCSDTYAGTKAFSEPEAQVLRDVMLSYVNRGKMYLTLHSYGSLLLYPWGYVEKLPENWRELDEVGQVGKDAIFNSTGTKYTVGMSTALLYAAAGASDDYAYSIGYPIVFTMELPEGGSEGFDPPASSIDGIVKETWVGVRAMAKKVIEKYPLQ